MIFSHMSFEPVLYQESINNEVPNPLLHTNIHNSLIIIISGRLQGCGGIVLLPIYFSV